MATHSDGRIAGQAPGRAGGPLEHACVLCGGTRFEAMPREAASLQWPNDWKLVGCSGCGLIFRHPLPDAEAIAAMYSQDYWDSFESHAGGKDQLPADMVERLDRIDALKPGRGRLVEVGPGNGQFLLEARRRGWDVQGVDVSEYAARQLRETHDLPVFVGTPEQAAFPDATFDVAYMNHVLEHLRDPIGTLQELRRVLKPGGLLVIEVPQEFTGLYEAAARVRERLGGKPLLPGTHGPSTHLFFYSPKTLAQMIRRGGFADVQVRVYRSSAYTTHSRFPGGDLALAAIYGAERLLQRAPLLEAFAS